MTLFEAYALLHGHSAEEQLKLDTEKAPEAPLTGYLWWLVRSYSTWREETATRKSNHTSVENWIYERLKAYQTQKE